MTQDKRWSRRCGIHVWVSESVMRLNQLKMGRIHSPRFCFLRWEKEPKSGLTRDLYIKSLALCVGPQLSTSEHHPTFAPTHFANKEVTHLMGFTFWFRFHPFTLPFFISSSIFRFCQIACLSKDFTHTPGTALLCYRNILTPLISRRVWG